MAHPPAWMRRMPPRVTDADWEVEERALEENRRTLNIVPQWLISDALMQGVTVQQFTIVVGGGSDAEILRHPQLPLVAKIGRRGATMLQSTERVDQGDKMVWEANVANSVMRAMILRRDFRAAPMNVTIPRIFAVHGEQAYMIMEYIASLQLPTEELRSLVPLQQRDEAGLAPQGLQYQISLQGLMSYIVAADHTRPLADDNPPRGVMMSVHFLERLMTLIADKPGFDYSELSSIRLPSEEHGDLPMHPDDFRALLRDGLVLDICRASGHGMAMLHYGGERGRGGGVAQKGWNDGFDVEFLLSLDRPADHEFSLNRPGGYYGNLSNRVALYMIDFGRSRQYRRNIRSQDLGHEEFMNNVWKLVRVLTSQEPISGRSRSEIMPHPWCMRQWLMFMSAYCWTALNELENLYDPYLPQRPDMWGTLGNPNTWTEGMQLQQYDAVWQNFSLAYNVVRRCVDDFLVYRLSLYMMRSLNMENVFITTTDLNPPYNIQLNDPRYPIKTRKRAEAYLFAMVGAYMEGWEDRYTMLYEICGVDLQRDPLYRIPVAEELSQMVEDFLMYPHRQILYPWNDERSEVPELMSHVGYYAPPCSSNGDDTHRYDSLNMNRYDREVSRFVLDQTDPDNVTGWKTEWTLDEKHRLYLSEVFWYFLENGVWPSPDMANQLYMVASTN
jgi:hypothetical protein